MHKRNDTLPVAPTGSTKAVIGSDSHALSTSKAPTRRERRAAYHNSPAIKAYYKKKTEVEKLQSRLRTLVADPAHGLYFSDNPSVKYAQCDGCNQRFEILKGSPLLDPNVQLARDSMGYGGPGDGWWILDGKYECPVCSSSTISLGWCCIVDTIEDDDTDPRVHAAAMKEGRKDGKTAAKEYLEDGDGDFHRYHGCECNRCIRNFELAKYDHKVAKGQAIANSLRDPSYVEPPQVLFRHGVKFEY